MNTSLIRKEEEEEEESYRDWHKNTILWLEYKA